MSDLFPERLEPVAPARDTPDRAATRDSGRRDSGNTNKRPQRPAPQPPVAELPPQPEDETPGEPAHQIDTLV